ncbi:hypothetical protein Bca101_096138 [Brassica carinata]
MRMLVLQCALINPPLKIPTAPQHPPSGSMISRSLFIPLSLLPQTSYMRSVIPELEIVLFALNGTVAQGFIGQNRRNQYEKELRRGRIYTLTNFYASNSKVMYHIADQRLNASESIPFQILKPTEISKEIFTLVEGQTLHQRPVLCTKDDSTSRKVMVHLQLKDGTVINVYLWDEAAENFRMKFDAWKLCLSSMSSSRVFLDEEVDPTKEYLTWLSTNPSATSSVNPVEVVKSETLTISEIADFIKRQPAKIAYVDCIATIDDVKLGTEWYYIACKDCQTKLNRGPTTMLCPKCGNENATAVANYRVEMSVYDNEEQCTFIILGDAGKDLTGRKATELIDTYVEENGGDGAELEIPLPQYFIDAIGQTKKFRIKVAHYNFTSTRLSLTDTKIVSSAVLPPKNPPLKTPPGSEVEMSELAESSGVVLQPVTTRRKQSVPSLVARSHAV